MAGQLGLFHACEASRVPAPTNEQRFKMNAARLAALAVLLALTPGCVTASTTATTWTEPQANWARYGHVTWIREYVQRREGNPAGGAVAGAIIGSILGGGRGPGAFVGAVGGAAIGAAASQGGHESRFYDVCVQFQDGGWQIFRYHGYPPFQPGEPVVQTPQGLYRA
jgi:outer membrane lipoprotein SlyB